MKDISVNGLVDEQTVQEMYDMLVENSRKYLAAIQRERSEKTQEQNTGKGFSGLRLSFLWFC